MRQLVKLLIFSVVLVTTSCNWQLRNTKAISLQIKKIILDSEDLNSPLIRAISNQLRLNNVAIVEKNSLCQDIPSFRVLSSSLRRDTVSIFQNGRKAEYQIMLLVNAMMLVPNGDMHPLSAKVHRSLFDNPQTALAKDAEQQLIINEIYDEVAEQLVRKLLSIQLASKRD